jgi:hypothetical protein
VKEYESDDEITMLRKQFDVKRCTIKHNYSGTRIQRGQAEPQKADRGFSSGLSYLFKSAIRNPYPAINLLRFFAN